MNATKQFDVVFTATDGWWEVQQNDFELADDCVRAALDETFTGDESYLADCDESFACTITKVDPEHDRLRVGDIVVSAGVGSDKIFLRRKA